MATWSSVLTFVSSPELRSVRAMGEPPSTARTPVNIPINAVNLPMPPGGFAGAEIVSALSWSDRAANSRTAASFEPPVQRKCQQNSGIVTQIARP